MYRTILVPVDGSAFAEQALPVAAALAKRDGAALHVVLVHQPLPMEQPHEFLASRLHEAEAAYIARVVALLDEKYHVRASSELLQGNPAHLICDEARALEADLVVMTTHGRTGLSRSWLGSVADAVMRGATTPVLMVRPAAEGTTPIRPTDGAFHCMLLPLDGSALAGRIVEHAVRLGGPTHCRYVLARIVEPVPLLDITTPPAFPSPMIVDDQATTALVQSAKEQTESVATALRRDYADMEVEVAVRSAPGVADALLDIAHDHGADVLAVASHGRGVSRYVLGSVADKLLRGSNCAVLVYHPPKD